MDFAQTGNEINTFPSFFAGGEMGRYVRSFDWSKSPIGASSGWSPGLQSALSICLNSNFPIAIYWGPDLVLIYNDAWSPIPGKKHPWALGKPAIEVWPDIWDAIEPQFQKAFRGEPGGSKDALLPMQRHGYTEECYFDFTFTPIVGRGGKVEGVFNAVIETTYRVIHDRRNAFLQQYTMQLAAIHQLDQLFKSAINTIETNREDIPFCLLYSCFTSQSAVLEASTVNALTFKKPWPLEEILEGKQLHIDNLDEYFFQVPRGPWPELPTEARILPFKAPDGSVTGFMVSGISARRKFDAEYQLFLESAASSLSAVINTIRSLEHERQKANALAEIDRAKTTFFSNISHEFRTPLTLLLGPVEEALNDPTLSNENKFRLEVVYRNARRMQKLVNNLLDFSRIEAGRMDARFVRTDIASYSAELASTFRSAIERAGMKLVIETEPVNGEVYLDRGMWEKIILNLLSNAFKYTKAGSITLKVQQKAALVEVSVADTGIGIPAKEIKNVFERFHRVDQTEGRSQEGSGIGLAMVQQLVQLHGGTVSVSSSPGSGSTFKLEIPTGHAHLPPDRVFIEDEPSRVATTTNFLEEAGSWFADTVAENGNLPEKVAGGKVLLAEDNADMRAYAKRLLSEYFTVITANNGEEALEKLISEKPDLLISDIMMPKLDGFGLLEKVRNHPDTRNLPVIFLSARAGEEAKVEGLNAGADDYLVKPFSARELLVRASNLIRMNQVRRETEKQFYELFLQAPAIINVFKGEDFRYELYHPKNKEIFNHRDFTGMKLKDALPELEGQGIFEMMNEVYLEGKTITRNELEVKFRNKDGQLEERYFNLTYQPWYDAKGKIQGVLNFAIEVTDMVRVRQRIEESEDQFRNLAESLPQLVWMTDNNGSQLYASPRWKEYTGIEPDNSKWDLIIHPDDRPAMMRVWADCLASGRHYSGEVRLKGGDGQYRWFYAQGVPVKADSGVVRKWVGSFTDIHDQKEIAEKLEILVDERTAALQRSNNDLQQFAHVASHDLKEPLRKIRTFTKRLLDDKGSSFSSTGLQYLGRVNSAADRMVEMIEGVLNYSMLNAGKQSLQLVDLNQVIANVTQDLELLIIEKNARISYQILPVIEGAAVLIYQLFYNLLNNSLKFSDIETGDPVINISAGNDETSNLVTIHVKDNGIGFESTYAESIFDAFSRLNSRDRYEGTGLGLSLCKRITERHGGSIRAISEPGKGALFIITLSRKLKDRFV